jgi:serine/threonine protein phosphatase PrpC
VKDAALLHSLPKSPLRDMKQTIREMRKRAQYGQNASHAEDPRGVISSEDFKDYAHFIDHAYFEMAVRDASLLDVGCRGSWLAAALQDGYTEAKFSTEKRLSSTCVRVLAANVGDSRCFAIAVNPSTAARRSVLDPKRHRLIPLSNDHSLHRGVDLCRLQAAGCTRNELDQGIDGNPLLNVSRSFGHWSKKNNPRLSPAQQKLIVTPSTAVWEMAEGDVVVVTNRAIFDTRGDSMSTVDSIADVVMDSLGRGSTCAEAAGALCDFAIRFGAAHHLQAAVVQVRSLTGDLDLRDTLPVSRSIAAGPLYYGAVKQSHQLYSALTNDCTRLGISLADLLEKRWSRVRGAHRQERRSIEHLVDTYGKEASQLLQMIDEEVAFFAGVTESADDLLRSSQFAALARTLVPMQDSPASSGQSQTQSCDNVQKSDASACTLAPN